MRGLSLVWVAGDGAKGPFLQRASAWGLADGGMRPECVAKRSCGFYAALGEVLAGFATMQFSETVWR